MPASDLLDVTGRRCSPAATPGFLCGRVPPNKGRLYPPDPPRPEEIILVMRQAGETRHGLRIRALIAVLWRGGLRISGALALTETDIDKRRGALLIRHGKGDRRREVGMDAWGFEHIGAWLEHRVAVARRTAALRDRRTDLRPAVVGDRSPRRTPPTFASRPPRTQPQR
jgi:site-specific recombinase XerC